VGEIVNQWRPEYEASKKTSHGYKPKAKMAGCINAGEPSSNFNIDSIQIRRPKKYTARYQEW
jgi:hypothetical protein